MFAYTSTQKEALRLLSGPAQHCMLYGGSRSGKSFVLCCALAARALRAPGSRHAVIRRYCVSARNTIGSDTMPKVLRSRFGSRLRWRFNRAEGFFRFGNDSEIWLIGLDDGDRADKILGKEFATIYFNECSELDYSSVQTALTRLAQNVPPLLNRAYYDCNPPGKTHWSYRLFVEKCDPVSRKKLPMPENYAAMRINPEANRKNLPAGYIEQTLAGLPERQRKRFLSGQWADDLAGTLWNCSMIDSARVTEIPELAATVIAVDPAVNSGKECDMTGIVAAGRGMDGDFYILEDKSMRASPLIWVRQVIEMYHRLQADCVTIEVNNGGELFAALFAGEDDSVKIVPVRAVKDKFSRAEPVAAFYEKGIIHHLGYLPELEAEMCTYQPGNYHGSPDRMDAMVWAVTGLTGIVTGQRFILS
ncbi:MAG: hypothetical protein E7043_09205 [Lentisphaerae bacterium]|nr:hypothetical protein [Lentisphaerota bacterium]